MRKDACIADAWDVVGRKVAKERLLADIMRPPKHLWGCLLAWILTRSVWSAWSSGKVAVVRSQGRSLIAQRNQIEDSAAALVKDLPDYQLLTSVPGTARSMP